MCIENFVLETLEKLLFWTGEAEKFWTDWNFLSL
jgi:hypothetical protein